MTVSRTSTDFAARIRQIGYAAQNGQIKGVERASLLVKREIEKELTRAVGGDHRLSNLRKTGGAKPKQLRVGYKTRKQANPTSLLYALGPWHLIEYGAKEHRIFPTLGRIKGRRVDRARAYEQRAWDQVFGARGIYRGLRPMPMNGYYRWSAKHPGMKGKLPFHKGLERATPRAVKELHSAVHSAIADIVRSGRETYVYARGDVGRYT